MRIGSSVFSRCAEVIVHITSRSLPSSISAICRTCSMKTGCGASS
jgi:hypothetical protein